MCWCVDGSDAALCIDLALKLLIDVYHFRVGHLQSGIAETYHRVNYEKVYIACQVVPFQKHWKYTFTQYDIHCAPETIFSLNPSLAFWWYFLTCVSSWERIYCPSDATLWMKCSYIYFINILLFYIILIYISYIYIILIQIQCMCLDKRQVYIKVMHFIIIYVLAIQTKYPPHKCPKILLSLRKNRNTKIKRAIHRSIVWFWYEFLYLRFLFFFYLDPDLCHNNVNTGRLC